MKTKYCSLFLGLLFLLTIDMLYAQLPYVYVSDIYDLEWCRNNNIKTIKRGADDYTYKNNIMLSDRADNLMISKDGQRIEYTVAKGSLKVTYILSDDLQRLQEKRFGAQTTYYNYDKNNQLTHKLSTTKSHFGNPSMQEIIRNSKGQIHKIHIYDFIDPVTGNMKNLKHLQSLKKTLRETWEYEYSEKGNLLLINIHRSFSDKSYYWIKPIYNNDLPEIFEITELEGETVKSRNKEKFSYTRF